MIKFSVSDMECAHCVARIEKALSAEGLKFSVSLADKTVAIDGCEKCESTAAQILDDLGFTAKRI